MSYRIDRPHPDYVAMSDRWARCRAFADSADAVKSGGKRFVPKPPGLEEKDYPSYVERGDVPAAVPRAVAGLSGLVFGKSLEVEAPSALDDVLEDVDLQESTIDTFGHSVLGEQLTVGRGCIVTDWSVSENRPYLTFFGAEDVLQWFTARMGGDMRLVKVVLRERSIGADMKATETLREYWLDGSGRAFVRTWSKVKPEDLTTPSLAKWEPSAPVMLKRRGEALTFLPVVLFGATRVSPDVETPPLMGLVDAALSTFRLSCEHRLALWHLIPTIYISSDAALASAGDIKLGPSVYMVLEQGASAGTLGLDGANVQPLADALEAKRREMTALGAKMLETAPETAETATAAQLRHAAEFATLRSVAGTLGQVLTTALSHAAWWATGSFDVTVTPNKHFFNVRSTPEEIRALTESYMAGAMSFDTYFTNMQRGGVMPAGITVEQERHAIGRNDEMPARLGPNLEGR